MLVYILKSAACLAILFVFYKVFLEKENMHVFKRFYLLGALLFSMIIPSLVFTEYVEVEPTPAVTESTSVITQQATYTNDIINVPQALEADVLDVEPVLWGIYFIGLFFFGLKFIRNLFQIFRRIRKNPKQKLSRFTQVLLQEKITPHTFFSYIFLNKKKFETDQIPAEVLLHEQTHASQKHSWDVILVELLHVIFWINPFIYLTKKAIKLNHEFLADQAVLKKDIDKTTYQNTLLSYLSPDSEKKYQPLANAINYSSIKKRFTVMKTHTSKKAVFLRTFLILPLLALMLYGFSETKVETIVIDSNNKTNPESELAAKGSSNRSVELAGLILDSETLLPIENAEIYDSNDNMLSKTDERGYYMVQFDKLEQGEIKFEFSLRKDGYKTLAQREHWGDLNGKMAFTMYYGLQKKESNTPEFSELIANNRNLSYWSINTNFHLVKTRFEFKKKTDKVKNGNQQIFFEIDDDYYLINDSSWIKINSKEDLISIDDNLIVPASEVNGLLERKEITGMTPFGKNRTALFGIYTIPVNSVVVPNRIVSKEEIKDYNELAKKYNAIPIEKRVIPLKDLKILETVFRKMSSDQKSENQPFPECLPKNTQDGASRKLLAEYNKLAKYYNDKQSNNMRIKMKDVQRLEYIYGLMSKKQKADAEPFPDFPEPPPPPKAAKAPKPAKEPKELKSPKAAKAPRVLKGEVSDIPPPPTAPNYQEIEEVQELEEEAKIREQEVLMEQQESKLVEQEILMEKEEAKMIEQEVLMEKKEAKLEQQKILMEQKEAELEEIEEELQRVKYIKGEVDTDILEPPTPPTPKSPLDHVIEMAKKDAIFYLEGKEITSDKAIEIMKKNKDINIDSRSSKGKRPMVKMSSKPIKIGYSTPKSKADLQKVEFVAMMSNEDLSRKKIIDRIVFFNENLRNCSEYFFDGKSISENEALNLYAQNDDILITQEDYDSKGLIIKC